MFGTFISKSNVLHIHALGKYLPCLSQDNVCLEKISVGFFIKHCKITPTEREERERKK
jgi:hypothetical protein